MPFLEDLAVGRFLVAEQQVGVDWFVSLTGRGVDLRLAEQGVDAERAGLVRDDRHDPAADVGVAEQVAQQPGERRGGRCGDLVACAGQQLAIWILSRQDERAVGGPLGRAARPPSACRRSIRYSYSSRVETRVGVGWQLVGEEGIGDR